ncbi:MAG: peptidylprolyl isomerase [Patescibacteria group bacterium]|nr:peptidylprolyl isomerase [Patescibacteria group bacterium]
MADKTNRKPNFTIDTSKSYTAVLKTSKGTIRIALNDDQTPKTVGNFVNLAKDKFYDGTIFHRTIKGFMIQGGDPLGTGAGGPGYKFEDEKFEGKYERGIVAMANAGPNTNGSQFFIMHADYPLPPNYTIFGKVIEGLDVVDAIATAPTQPGGEGSKPVNPVKIETVEIIEE